MSIANRVFMLFGALMILMLGSQWYMMRSITEQVSSELGKVAFSVAKDTAGYFILNDISWVASGLISNQSSFTTSSQIQLHSNGEISRSTAVIELQAPSIEVRIDNQRTDNEIQLISGNRSTSIPLPREEMTAAVSNLQQQMIISTLIILGVGLLLAAFLARKLMQPIQSLSMAAHKVAKGSLGTQIELTSRFSSPEISNSVDTFNEMSTRLKVMQDQNQELLANAHYKELGYISSGLAHSIRNPLNTLGLTLEQIIESRNNESMSKQLLDSAYRQIARIDNWVKTFMTFALGTEAETSEIKLKSVIESIILETNQMRENVSIDSNFNNEISIHGIEAELYAIFQSLIVNAVEASPENESVKLSFVADDGFINCKVQDYGSGIPESVQETLFQPHKTTKINGSGMGLYMAQKLAENRYKGAIRLIQSSPDGTIIELKLKTMRNL